MIYAIVAVGVFMLAFKIAAWLGVLDRKEEAVKILAVALLTYLLTLAAGAVLLLSNPHARDVGLRDAGAQ